MTCNDPVNADLTSLRLLCFVEMLRGCACIRNEDFAHLLLRQVSVCLKVLDCHVNLRVWQLVDRVSFGE